jgi:hypothetical protein
MKPRRVVAMWVVTMLALIATTFVRWRRPDAPHVATLTIPAVLVTRDISNEPLLDSMASEIVSHDPFRLAHMPAHARYAVTTQSATGISPAARESPPAMTLKAIAGGPPWQALIDGVPGQAGAVLVRSGTVLDRLSIGSITRSGVVVRGSDTTWVLSFPSRP